MANICLIIFFFLAASLDVGNVINNKISSIPAYGRHVRTLCPLTDRIVHYGELNTTPIVYSNFIGLHTKPIIGTHFNNLHHYHHHHLMGLQGA